ncbi:SPOSA6832_03615 [Sporobolomyces salmonicolor]|uniref:(2E,6E)-farnesyl diphosphate synthase n=1 Tax=Sporidiobolus salmonicolor TaxID=5005 RepID=A0A0D6EPH1_SPOSA|nr:SPOSA6832_03615 [Sporobolomyces salmonicolor]
MVCPRQPLAGCYRPVLAPSARPCKPPPSSIRFSAPPSSCTPPRARRHVSSSSRLSAWTSVLPMPSSTSSSVLAGRSSVQLTDPLKLLSSELSFLRENVSSLLGSSHPTLDTIAKYYFQAEGKHVRPMIVLLMSQATNGMSPVYEQVREREEERDRLRREGKGLGVDEPINGDDILQDENPSLAQRTRDFLKNPLSALSSSPSPEPSSLNLLPTQRRLAEITELIHVASLLHDDVIDVAATRRGAPSAPNLFGNKLSILAGDFLLARASLALSRLGSNEVVELVASVLANLVEGEVMQMKGNVPSASTAASAARGPTPEIFQHYMRKTYLKTASLIAKSARATTVLGGCGVKQGWAEGERVKDVAYDYGRNLGIAFQLIDDMLDFTASAAELGKPGGGADLKLGLATAPALYAWEEFPELGEMIERKFASEGDVERAKHLITRSSGASRTYALAEEHSRAAIEALHQLPESDARDGLEKIAKDVLTRSK